MNLHLLPSFPSQDLLPDGKFLSPVSGLHYVLFLFDQTELLLSRLSLNEESRFSLVQEQVRHHEDRMSYIENNHICLQQQVDTKVARDAEFHDWIQNKNEEDWLVFKGLPRLTDVTNQEWPKAAAKQVIDAINLILKANRARLDFDVLYVANPFKLQNTGPTTYNVRMDSVFSSKRLREVFSGFFRHHKPVPLPPALKGVSLRNRINLETKIRISILHQLGGIYRDSNAGASYKVRGYDPRPVLLTIPPRSGSGRARTYNFIQAATTLPATFSDEQLVRIFQVVGDRFRGHLQALFIVLRDDDHDRCLELVRVADRRPNRARQPVSGANAIPSGSATSVGHVFGSGAGMETEANRSLHGFNPQPPTEVQSFPRETSVTRAHDARVRARREHVRQPTPEGDRHGLKRCRQSSSSSPERTKKSKKHKKSSKRTRRSPSRSASPGSASGSDSEAYKTKSRK